MSSGAKIAAPRVAEIVGPANAVDGADKLAAYEVDGVRPGAAARPETAEEIAGLVKYAATEKLAVIPIGARTMLGIGMPPARYDLAIDMTRLDRVISYDPGDLTLSVEPGIPLAKLAATLAEHKQFLPLGVPFFDCATVGGTLASGVDSPLRHAYGTAREFVLGMEFVSGDGAVTKSGGRVVKNVSGYDLHKLMLGAIGSLGVITRVNFKTFPRPALARGFFAAFETMEKALELRERIMRSKLSLLTLDLGSPGTGELFSSATAAKVVPEVVTADLPAHGKWTISCGFWGSTDVLARYEGDLQQMAADSGAIRVDTIGEDEIPGQFGRKREFVAIVSALSPGAIVMKLSVRASQLQEAHAKARSIVGAAPVDHVTLTNGAGVIYFAMLPRRTGDATQACRQATGQIMKAITALGGYATIIRCPLELKREINVWGAPREDFPLMQRVKRAFDPHDIFAPGRFVGGL
ncbi:MAG TPA: FAD-binding oxidoreductase [Candidatus Acidoferrales bacterium]|nr:FAD-binding oxidoreductase [Candidatus Acidoferrales bacterium]